MVMNDSCFALDLSDFIAAYLDTISQQVILLIRFDGLENADF